MTAGEREFARGQEAIFCSECQNEVQVDKARMVNGRILCPKDLAAQPFFARLLRARKLPGNFNRRTGKVFTSFFTSLAALMLVVGVAFVWKDTAGSAVPASSPALVSDQVQPAPAADLINAVTQNTTRVTDSVAQDTAQTTDAMYTFGGVALILASIFTLFFGLFAGDVIDLLLDTFDQLKRNAVR